MDKNYRIVKIIRIEEFGVYCEILDQPGYQGFISKGEVSSSWIKDINKVLKINQIRVGKVLDIDDNAKMITLSLKRVSEKEENEMLQRYYNEQTGINIIKASLAKSKLKKDLNFIVSKIKAKYNYIYDFLRDAANDENILESLDLPKSLKTILKEEISKRFSSIIYKIRINISATTKAEDGLIRIKNLFHNINTKYLGGGKYNILLEGKNPKDLKREAERLAKALEEKAKQLGVHYSYSFQE